MPPRRLDDLPKGVHQSDIDLRSRVLGKIAALWAMHPDLELVELIYEAADLTNADDLFWLQDTELDHGLDKRLLVERERYRALSDKVS